MTTKNEAITKEPKTVRSLIESNQFKEAIANVLPTHLTPSRFVRIAIAATTRTPRLNECDPNTVLQCLITLSQFGLEPDGRNAYLIPFWNSKRNTCECQLIISYMGLAALAKRSGQVSFIHADSVCENDKFEFNKGVVVKHEVDFKNDRGKPYAYYAMVRFKDGTEQAVCMTKADVERIRSRSRSKNDGPWVTDYDEMSKKSAFRRLSKWLELSPEFRDAIEADADALEELRFEQSIPIQRPKIRRLNDKDFGSGSEEPPPGDGVDTVEVVSPSPSGVSDETPVAAPKKKLKRRVAPSIELTSGPNEQAMLARLKVGNKSKDDLVRVCKILDALNPDGEWSDIGEIGFAELLHPENFPVVQEELEKL